MKLNKIIDQSQLKTFVSETIGLLLKRKGSIVAISGKSGMGKSYVLQSILEETAELEGFKTVLVENQKPIKDIKISNMTPFQPFTFALQQMINTTNAHKRLAMNIGMTTLASLPIIGDIFYAVKEYGRDWRQYKQEKSSDSISIKNKAVADFYDTFRSATDKNPTLLLMDNIDNADSLSLELLKYIAQEIEDTPLGIIFTYNPQNYEMVDCLSLENKLKSDIIKSYTLEPIKESSIRDFLKIHYSSYIPNSYFDEWLFKQTKGIPNLLNAYIHHFTKNPPFDPDGKLLSTFENTNIFPENINNALKGSTDNINEEDLNLLAICALEGNEFSAYLIAHLLNSDVLTTIKKLRSIQNKYNVIKSLGTRIKYGVKTTIYEFTEPFFHQYFENVSEYEEKISIHGQIAAFLKKKLQETSDTNLKHQLSSYVAAHSMIAGDVETAKEMLVFSAKVANQYHSKEMIEQAYETFKQISASYENNQNEADSMIFQDLLQQTPMNLNNINIDTESSNEERLSSSHFPIDFKYFRRQIVDEYHKKNYQKAIELAESYINSHKENLKPSEETQLLALSARCYIELNKLESAMEICNNALELLKDYKEPIPKNFLLNIKSLILFELGNFDEAYKMLQNAAKKSINLPDEIKLLSIANIAMLLKTIDSKQAERYLIAVRKLSKQLNFDEFAFEVMNQN